MAKNSAKDVQNLKADFSKLISEQQSIQKDSQLKSDENKRMNEEIVLLKIRNEGYEKRIEVQERKMKVF